MATTTIDTERCRRIRLPGMQGTVAEIVNKDLCGAKNVLGKLHWLKPGEHFDAESLLDKHQLIYFMEGDGVVTMAAHEYDLRKGAGVYLEPSETASIKQSGHETLKLFHLIVPRLAE